MGRLLASTPIWLLAAAVLAGPAAAVEPTGRWLVEFESASTAQSRASVDRVLDRAGADLAGRGAPGVGIATVAGPEEAIEALRRDPAVESVSQEYRRELRRTPSDPSLAQPETAPRTPSGTLLQWPLLRQGFPAAWDLTTGEGAVVGVIDTGIDGSHPELASKIASGITFGTGEDPGTDVDGHGTHVSGLACAATDDGAGVAGAGWGCRIAVAKTPLLRDEDIIRAVESLASQGVHAINMSFGGGPRSPAFDPVIDFAVRQGVVLVAAASNDAETDQGSPAAQLQPGNAADLTQGRGLVVTGVDVSNRNPAAGFGPQISMAAYGFFHETDGPPGLISTYPGAPTRREAADLVRPGCRCRASVGGDSRYAYLQGTSMAAPQVAAAAAMIGAFYPELGVAEKLRVLKETAQRPGGWTPELGWGILDAGRALEAARRIDRAAPRSSVAARRRMRMRRRSRRSRRLRPATIRLRLAAQDAPGRPELIPSGVRGTDVYARRGAGPYRRIATGTTAASLTYRVRRKGTYSFYTQAVDAVGNRQVVPARPTRVRLLGPKRPKRERRRSGD